MRHHPDCEWNTDQYPWECTCGLTAPRPAWSTLEPVSEEAWRAWVAKMERKENGAMNDDQDGYEGPIELEWDECPDRPSGLDGRVIADIRSSLWGLLKPADLMFHSIWLEDDPYGPNVLVYGREGSGKFHCEYHARADMCGE